MEPATIANTEASILSRVVGSGGADMSPSVAAELLTWGFSDDDRRRMGELAAKARAGELSDDERAEIEGYERVSSFLGVVKSKARRALRPNAGS